MFNMLLTAFNELKGQVSLENISDKLKHTNIVCNYLDKNTMANVNWEEINNGKGEQEENIGEVLINLGGESIVAFTDRSALGNRGPKGAGAVILVTAEELLCTVNE